MSCKHSFYWSVDTLKKRLGNTFSGGDGVD